MSEDNRYYGKISEDHFDRYIKSGYSDSSTYSHLESLVKYKVIDIDYSDAENKYNEFRKDEETFDSENNKGQRESNGRIR